jgi:tetratricopeptide (TPR) repeat protein
MRGLRYFLVVVVAAAGLALATRLVYSRNRLIESAPAAEAANPVVLASKPIVRQDSLSQPLAEPTPTAVVPRLTTPTAAPVVAPRASSSRSHPSVRMVSQAPAEHPHPTQSPPAAVETPNVIPAAPPAVEPQPAWQASPRQVARDSAFVMVSSGRLQAAIAVLDTWVRANPTDTAVVLDLARLKARAGDWTGSLALYTSLVEQHRTAPFLFERGQAYLWSGDAKRGEADLLASEALMPRAETERQLGDHYRWQGDYARSASWYRRALRSAPADTNVRNSMQLLDRAMVTRLMLPGELSGNDLGSAMQAISDNAGFDLYSLRLSQAFAPLPEFVVTLSGELRSATQMFGASENRLDAYGFDVMMARRVGLSKLTASVGLLSHGDEVSEIVRGSFTVDGFIGNARLKGSVHRAPAYETLWAPRMLGVSGSPSTTLGTQGNLSLPFGVGNEVYAMGEFLSVSDDNSRTAFQLALRRRLPAWLSLIYAGSVMRYREQTALYYSPARYVSHSLGLELARYREQGFSFAIRATPGYAWMREPAGTADSTTRDLSAFQFTTGLELGYRRGAWDLLFSSGLSDGREGGYQSRNALLFLRRAW